MLRLAVNGAELGNFNCTCKGGTVGGFAVSAGAAWSTFFCTVTAKIFRRVTNVLRKIRAFSWGRKDKSGSCGAGLFRHLGVMRL